MSAQIDEDLGAPMSPEQIAQAEAEMSAEAATPAPEAPAPAPKSEPKLGSVEALRAAQTRVLSERLQRDSAARDALEAFEPRLRATTVEAKAALALGLERYRNVADDHEAIQKRHAAAAARREQIKINLGRFLVEDIRQQL